MTTEEIQAKADELSKKLSVNVLPIVFVDEDTQEQVIGFIKEPARFVKLRAMDKAMTAPMSASAELYDACVIKEESDARLYSDKPENDKYYMGATVEAFKTVEISVNSFKKK